MANRDERLESLESAKPDRCPECRGKMLWIEHHPDGTHYPFGPPCSTCGNRRSDGGLAFIEIDCTGTNQRPRDDGDTEEE
jgi:DNA-directed RNA polymerase subunit RPC12/RpoP